MVDKQIFTARLGQTTLVSMSLDSSDNAMGRKVALLLSEMGRDLAGIADYLGRSTLDTAQMMLSHSDIDGDAEALLLQIDRMRRTGFRLICLDGRTHGDQIDDFADQGLVIHKRNSDKISVRLTALGEAAALIASEDCVHQSAA